MAQPLLADQFGDFTYTDNGTSITITDYPDTAVGAIEIPATIAGKPVTNIAYGAFHFSSLTSITIPSSVTYIADQALRFCTNLKSIAVDPLNAYYNSMDGVL